MDQQAWFVTLMLGIVIGVIANFLAEPIASIIRRIFATRNEEIFNLYCRILLKNYDRSDLFTQTTNQLPVTIRLKEIFIPLTIVSLDRKDIFTSTADEMLASERSHMVLFGKPGSGKTTLLRYTIASIASQKEKRTTLPIYIQTKHFSPHFRNKAFVEIINDYIANSTSFSLPSNLIRSRLMTGDCIILIDGLDEVHESHDTRLLFDFIHNGISDYPKARFVLTSRYSAEVERVFGSIFKTYNIQDFDNSDIRRYVGVMTNTLSSSTSSSVSLVHKQQVLHTSQRFMRILSTDRRLAELAKTPLFLSLLFTQITTNSAVPAKISQLYQRYISSNLEGSTPIATIPFIFKYLESLAFLMHTNHKSVIDKKEANRISLENKSAVHEFNDLVNLLLQSNILSSPFSSQLVFSHMSFQEFFAARYLITNDINDIAIDNLISDDWWHPVLLIYCGLSGNANRFLETVLASSSLDQTRKSILLGLCLSEATSASSTVREQVYVILAQAILNTHLSSDTHQNIYDDLFNVIQRTNRASISCQILIIARQQSPQVRARALHTIMSLGLFDNAVREQLYIYQLDKAVVVIEGSGTTTIGKIATEILDRLSPTVARLTGI